MVSKNNHEYFIIGAVFSILLIIPLFFKGTYIMEFLAITAIWVIFATSLRLLTTVGLVSFAHNGFLAIGAYTSALLTTKFALPFWLALISSGISAGVFALIIGYPLLRTKGHYFFLTSFALGMVIILFFNSQLRSIFGGPKGISNIPYPAATFDSPIPHYYLALGVATLITFLVYRLDRCRIGMEWHAIRAADDLAALLGINVITAKMVAFVAACFFAGISGSLYAHYTRFICPDSFTFHLMLACLCYVIVGGMYSTWGPAIGVLIFRALSIGLAGLSEWEILIYSATLILCIILLPGGLASLPQRLKARMR